MLGAGAELLADRRHLVADVLAVHESRTRRRGQHTREHVHGGGLAGAVVAQQRRDLSFVHLEAQVVDGHLLAGVGVEHLAQAPHDDAVAVREVLGHLVRHGLDVVVLLGRSRHGLVVVRHRHGVHLAAAAADLPPVVRGEEEPGLPGHAPLRGRHLVEVPGDKVPDEDVRDEHAEGVPEGEVVLFGGVDGVGGDADAALLVLGERHRREREARHGVEARRELGAGADCVHPDALVERVARDVEDRAQDRRRHGPREAGREREGERRRRHEEKQEERENEAAVGVLEERGANDVDQDGLDEVDDEEEDHPAAPERRVRERHHLHALPNLRLLLRHEHAHNGGKGVDERDGKEDTEKVSRRSDVGPEVILL
mmetsp:Transcript_17012/g.52230  ORF Transcript_17012/g.52230 Transcript_17012/m.52230 type:complete len:369 (-) Transcript_17012:1307-2413(-)